MGKELGSTATAVISVIATDDNKGSNTEDVAMLSLQWTARYIELIVRRTKRSCT